VAGIGLVAWFFTVAEDPNVSNNAQAQPETTSVDGEPSAPPVATSTPAPQATSTSIPPTPVPTPQPFVEAARLTDLSDVLITPLPECGLLGNDERVAGTITLRCLGDAPTVPVVASADGRVVGVVTSEAVAATLGAPAAPGQWSWGEQLALGPHVIVDHGPLSGTNNTQTVYAGLAAIEEGIRIGAVVVAGQPLGTITGPEASLRFSVWANDVRQDGATTLAAGPGPDDQRSVAAALRPLIQSPTDERCPIVFGFGQLPGAPREYRNGTHRGIDFGCGAADRSAFAIADGTVVYLVDDYQDPRVSEREALLQQAGIAGFTPHWTLVMLYGNVVVVDHGDVPGVGRMVTISAHLEEVDPAISIGSQVTSGQRLGELGNRGTNASALGIRGDADPSLHLHWELFIDNWYLGSGLDAATVSEIVSTALCGAAQTAGCPS